MSATNVDQKMVRITSINERFCVSSAIVSE